MTHWYTTQIVEKKAFVSAQWKELWDAVVRAYCVHCILNTSGHFSLISFNKCNTNMKINKLKTKDRELRCMWTGWLTVSKLCSSVIGFILDVPIGTPQLNIASTTYCIYYVEIKCQLDATDDFYCRSYCLLNMFRASLCPSSGAWEYYTGGCCLWYLVLWFSSCRYGVELNLKTKAPNTNTLELLMMGIMVPETCWASNKICNKNHPLHLVGILFPHIEYDAVFGLNIFVSKIGNVNATQPSGAFEILEIGLFSDVHKI